MDRINHFQKPFTLELFHIYDAKISLKFELHIHDTESNLFFAHEWLHFRSRQLLKNNIIQRTESFEYDKLLS